jgi:O-antigen/teichoic acid export membrane protein
MQPLRRSLIITFLSTNSGTVIQFVVVMILSRLLNPSEVGIFSITSVFISILSIFRDFGVTSYIQREKDLTVEKTRSALGLLLTSSWLLAAILYFSSGMVADFYHQPGIGEVMRVLTISFFLLPFASYFYALLARNLQSGRQAIVNIISTVTYAITCVSLAYLGFSYMALAWANVVNIAVTILVFVCVCPPGTPFIPSFRNLRSPIRFGSGAILGNLINQANAAVPDLVLGKLSGPHNVGLYSRANGLVGIFQLIAGPTINYHAVPYIARQHHAGEPLGPILAKSVGYLTCLAWPVYIVTAAFAAPIIHVLYGAKWVEAAPVVVFICIQAATRVGFSLCEPALLAVGKPYLSALSSGAGLVVRLVLVLLLGANDVVMFAAALCIADLLVLPVPAILMARHLGYSYALAFASFLKSAKVALLCLAVVLGLKAVLPDQVPALLVVILLGLVTPASWVLGIILFRHPIAEEVPAFLRTILPAPLAGRIAAWFVPHAR